VFNLCNVLQEGNPPVKQDLPILHLSFLLFLLSLLLQAPTQSPLLLITYDTHRLLDGIHHIALR